MKRSPKEMDLRNNHNIMIKAADAKQIIRNIYNSLGKLSSKQMGDDSNPMQTGSLSGMWSAKIKFIGNPKL